MAYSTNPVTVERMLPYLEPLLKDEETLWRTDPGRSHWLAYKIREALQLARQFPLRFPKLASVDFKVEVMSSREVRARRRAEPTVATEKWQEPVPASARVEIRAIYSAQYIIHAWAANNNATGKLYFPGADVNNDELISLYEWAQEAAVLIFENHGAITLLPLHGNEDAAAYAWTPEELGAGDSL